MSIVRGERRERNKGGKEEGNKGGKEEGNKGARPQVQRKDKCGVWATPAQSRRDA